MAEQIGSQPHLLIFPFPVQGHINSMLKLTELLCLANIEVTYLLTLETQTRLLANTNVVSRYTKYPGLRFQTLPESVSDGNAQSMDIVLNLYESLKTAKAFLRDLLLSEGLKKPVTCIITDGLMKFTLDVGEEIGVPVIYFRTISKLQTVRAQASILNTFEDLEGPILSQLRTQIPNIYTVGPIHAHLKAQTKLKTTSSTLASSNSLWEEDKGCIKWLEDQPLKSVIYVSFGSLAVVTKEQLLEFWHGLGDDMDFQVKSVPGMEGFLRKRDLPSLFRVNDINDSGFQMLYTETLQTLRAHALILNTFEDLEGPILSQIRTQIPHIYTIGPIHAHLKAQTKLETNSSRLVSSNSLWEEDKGCIKWLEDQPLKSVIYVSFGSLAMVTKEQLLEFWHGLVNSGHRFLWVIRPDSITGTDGGRMVPAELEEGTKARGYMVHWAPQEEVLGHPAIGGFLTHSGWNSTLESICEGVPMICWPYFADQQINSRFVGEVWKLGSDIKDTCDKVIIEKSVKEIMGERKEEFAKSAKEMATYASKAINGGGSSHSNLNRLIEDIKAMSVLSQHAKTQIS